MSRLSVASLVCLGIACLATGPSAAQQAGPALTGTVTAGPEALEGVLVSARKSGSTITVTVVSDKDGRYSFPAARLEPGAYALRIRAVGYDLDGPAQVSVVAPRRASERGARRSARTGLPWCGGLSRQHQSQHESHLEFRAQNAAASDWSGHPRHLHRIRSAARNHRTA